MRENVSMRRFQMALGVCLMGVVAIGHPVQAEELLVPQEFEAIQAAIQAAVPGDEVVVAPGTYAESIDLLGKTIVVRSTDGAAVTTIDATGLGEFGVTVANGEGAGTRVAGFTLLGGSDAGVRVFESSLALADCDIIGPSGGVSAEAATVTIDGCTFGDNHAFFGGGVDAYLSDVTVVDSTFVGNTSQYGGAVSVAGGSVNITNSTFSENTAQQFGGAIYTNAASVLIDGITATDNGSVTEQEDGSYIIQTGGGGGIFVKESTGSLLNSRFAGNGAFSGGAIYIRESSDFTVANVLANDNFAVNGGGFYINTCSPLITNVTVVNNRNGFFAYYNSQPSVVNSIFADNGDDLSGYAFAGQGITQLSRSLVNGFVSIYATDIGPGVLQDADPLLDAAFQPTLDSPVIDAGDNTVVPEGLLTDLNGAPRFVDVPAVEDTGVGDPPLVDFGAFEYQVQERTESRDHGRHNSLRPSRGALFGGGLLR